MDPKNVVVGRLSWDWDKGLSGLCKLEGDLFGRHGAAEKSMVIVVGLPVAAVWEAYPFVN